MDHTQSQTPPTTSFTPHIPEEHKPEHTPNSQKPLIIILALLTLLCFLAGGYFYFQNQTLQKKIAQIQPTISPSSLPFATTDPTADWETDTSTQYGFSFKYPPDFSLKEDIGGSGNVFYADLNTNQEEFRFEIGPKDYVGLFEHFKTDQVENINGTSWIVVASSEYCDAGNCGPTASGYYIKKDDYYVGISEIKKDQSLQTLKKILSTFKFTN